MIHTSTISQFVWAPTAFVMRDFCQPNNADRGLIMPTYQTLEMLHEHLQADIIGEDCLACSPGRITVHTRRHVRRRWVQLRKQESRLTASLVADNVSRDRETIDEQILNRRRQSNYPTQLQTMHIPAHLPQAHQEAP